MLLCAERAVSWTTLAFPIRLTPSSYAHRMRTRALFRSGPTKRARRRVLAVLTADDMKAANVGSVSRHPPVPGRGGAKMVMPFRPSLAGEKVMHVGDPVAMVVAEFAEAAQDAADLVQVEYKELPAVIDLDDAMKKGGTQLYAERQTIFALTGRVLCPTKTISVTLRKLSPRRRMLRR